MLADHMLTTAIRAHRQAKRAMVPCAACGTKCVTVKTVMLTERCRSHSTILPSLAATTSASRASTPSSSTTSSTLQANGGPSNSLAAPNGNGSNGSRTPNPGVGGSTGIGSGSGRPDGTGNVFFDCLNCGRPVSVLGFYIDADKAGGFQPILKSPIKLLEHRRLTQSSFQSCCCKSQVSALVAITCCI
jgi:hypothetical protein